MKLKKWFGAVLSLLLVVAMAIGMVACAPEGSEGEAKEPCESHPTEKLVYKQIEGDDNVHQIFCTECNNNVKKDFHHWETQGEDRVCKDCGYVCTHSHTTYSRSDDYMHHYKSCVGCFIQLEEEEEHDMVNGVCSKCEITQDDLDLHDVNNTVWEIIGNGGGMMGNNTWQTGGKRLKKVADDANKATITGNMYVGDLFKIHDSSATSDDGAWFGMEAVTAASKTYVAADSDNYGGSNIKVLQDGVYTITFTLTDHKIDVVRDRDITSAKEYYLVGCIGGTDFDDETRTYKLVESTTVKGVWTIDYEVKSNYHPSGWGEYVPEGCAKYAIYDVEVDSIVDGSQTWVETGKTYTFAFNGSVLQAFDQGTTEFTFNEWFLVGNIGGNDRWEGQHADLAFTKGADDTYTYTFTFNSGDTFKVRHGKTYIGFDSIKPAATGFSRSGDAGDIQCDTAGTYTITVTGTGSTATLKIEAAATD